MLLLTGATGTVGTPLLRRLTDAGIPVRCLVRDPRRLGAQRVRVQIALGNLEDHLSFRHALRGVDTVVHLASVIRDQPGGSIEELAGVATWRLVQAAEQAGVSRFLFFSTLSASTRSRARLMRAKAVAERAVMESGLAATVFAPSLVYAPGDPYLRLLGRMSLLPAMAIPGPGRTPFQPIWAEDVADCVMATLPGGRRAEESVGRRLELAGPETLTHRELVERVLQAQHRRRPVVSIPCGSCGDRSTLWSSCPARRPSPPGMRWSFWRSRWWPSRERPTRSGWGSNPSACATSWGRASAAELVSVGGRPRGAPPRSGRPPPGACPREPGGRSTGLRWGDRRLPGRGAG